MVIHHLPRLAGASVTGETPGQTPAPPTVLRFSREDFVPHLLAELQSPEGRRRLEDLRQTPPPGSVLVLEQPVHRAFHLVLVDAYCLAPGWPPLDPARIHSAGLVVRRRTTDGPQGWLRRDGLALGWRPLPAGAVAEDSDYEPDPQRRRTRWMGSNGAVLGRLTSFPGELDHSAEDVLPLFKLPPEVAKAQGRTLLYGWLPLSASEQTPPDNGPPPFTRTHVADRIPPLFRPDRSDADTPPFGTGEAVSQAEAQRPSAIADPDRQTQVAGLRDALTWLAQETGAFTGEDYAQPLVDALGAVALDSPFDTDLYQWLARAYRVLVELRDDERPPLATVVGGGAGGLLQSVQINAEVPPLTAMPLPAAWPLLDGTAFETLIDAAHAALTARWRRLAPAVPRYPAGRARYHLRCFARVEVADDCPPRIVWSSPSAAFSIKPWYESGDAPPVQVELPPLTPDRLKDLKPNVAFKVPPEVQQFMDGLKLDDLLEGKKPKTKLGIGMLCGFNIPIITLCAFIVLQIFLVLFHILFFWLPFIRICIPIPIVTNDEEEGN